jgi:hypothetical protein
MRPQELPPRPAQLVLHVGTDVTAPDHVRPGLCQRCGQPGGLRVVQHDQVAAPDTGTQLPRARREHLRVMGGLGCAEWTTVARLAVDPVV